EDALGAGALDPHRDAGELRLERFGDLLGERQVDRRVVDDLALLLGRRDQVRRDRGRGRRLGAQRRREHRRGRGRARDLEYIAPGKPVASHYSFPLRFRSLFRLALYPSNARQRSGGRWSQTFAPCGMLSCGAVTARSWVPSASSTI